MESQKGSATPLVDHETEAVERLKQRPVLREVRPRHRYLLAPLAMVAVVGLVICLIAVLSVAWVATWLWERLR
jgi:hypothetical protein